MVACNVAVVDVMSVAGSMRADMLGVVSTSESAVPPAILAAAEHPLALQARTRITYVAPGDAKWLSRLTIPPLVSPNPKGGNPSNSKWVSLSLLSRALTESAAQPTPLHRCPDVLTKVRPVRFDGAAGTSASVVKLRMLLLVVPALFVATARK
jgi:hypothetical protein